MPTFLHNQAGWNINGTMVERKASGVIKAGDTVSPKWEEYRTTSSGTYSFDDINTIRTFLIPKDNGEFRYVDFFMENISVWDDDSDNHWYVAQLKFCVSDSPDFTNFVIAPTRIVFDPDDEDGDFSSHPHLYVFELNVGIYFVYTPLGGRVVRINNPLSTTPTFTLGTVIPMTDSTTDTGFATKLPAARYGYILGRYIPEIYTLLLENSVSYNYTTHTHQVIYDIVKINYVSGTAQLCTIQRARQTLEVPLTVWSGSTYYPMLFEYVAGHLYLTADEITYETVNSQERIMNHVYIQEYTLSGTTLTSGDVRLNTTVFTGNLRYTTTPNPHSIFTSAYLRVYDEFIVDQCQIDTSGNVIPQRLFSAEDKKGLSYYSLSAPLILTFVTTNNTTTIYQSIMSSPNQNLLNPTCIYSTFLNKWLCFYYTYQEDEYAYDFAGGFLAANSLADFHNKLMTGEYVPENQFFRPVVMIDTENIILMRSVAETAASASSHFLPNQVDTLICQSCQAGSSAPIGIALTPGEDSKILVMKFK